jgi:cytochrome c oxidase subunit 2
MKKAGKVLAAVALAFALTACSEDKPSSTTNGGDSGNEVKIVATNFKFDQDVYKVKKGEPVTLKLESQEGFHGIQISGLDVNLQPNESVTITPEEAGEYEMICSIMCGTGHAKMKAKLVVE